MKNLFKSKWGKWQDLGVIQIGDELTIVQFRRHENGKIKLRKESKKSVWGNISNAFDKLKGVEND